VKTAFRGVRRPYRIVGLSEQGTLIIQGPGEEPRDTNETATEWVGNADELRPEGVFHYFRDEEQKILRRGLRLDLKKH